MPGEKAITIRFKPEVYEMIVAKAAQHQDTAKPNVTGFTRSIILENVYSGSSPSDGPEQVSSVEALAAPAALFEELLEQVVAIQEQLDEAHRERYNVARIVLGGILSDAGKRASAKAVLEANLGPAPELRESPRSED